MAVDIWPSELPSCFILGSHNETLPEGRLKSEMDAGPAKIRRRSSAMPYPLSGSLRMTLAQLNRLKTFTANTLLGGSLPFRFPSQYGGSALLVRFVSASVNRTLGNKVIVDISLEVLPQ